MTYVLLILGFVILIYCADVLVDGAVGLAKRYKISDFVIGMTIVAFGTSMPEFVVNITASLSGSDTLALTNILGSNTMNVLMILGFSALIYPIPCKSSTIRYEIPLSILAGLCVMAAGTNLFGLASGSGGFVGVSRLDGVVLVLIFCGFMAYSVRQARKDMGQEAEADYHAMKAWKSIVYMLAGFAGLTLGSRLIVDNSVEIARSLGVSEAVIGATIVAIGTSLPELAASAAAAYRHNTDIAIANVIGSNIFNVFFVLGVSAIINPLSVYGNIYIDSILAAGSSALLLLCLLLSRKREVNRKAGLLMLIVYLCYVARIILA